MANLSHQQNIIGDELTPEQVQELQRFGALEWNPRDIAISMGFGIDQFSAEYKDPDSIVSLAITRGRLHALATISTRVLDNAELGDLPSILHLEKIRREKSFQTSKLDIFGGFDDQKSFERVSEYIATGRTSELTNNEKLFIDMLSIINSLDRQFGKRATIKLLTQQFGYSYDRAVDYYDQADQLFYSTRNTTKQAMRNKYAEMLDNLAHAARAAAQTPKDYEAVSEIIAKAAKIRKLDEPEIQKLPAAMYLRQIRMFSLTPEVLGLPPVNRQEVNDQIQQLHIPEIEKRRLRQEALIEDVDIIELFEHGKSCEN
ncbi:MAG: hypothetical protein RRY23_00115 [Alistipes sp.]